ncbi:glycoside hydrolase family 3 N-terminal domain-containing protein [uncultured Cohaesibacter sp.]|uniref:glycoside hydrolase family 3 protein n=1 Tax=uncultured Cohaesibacter sp. TaxID=1002546 RepID=UPI0029C6CB6A|nr:glycoside hydrolase family 3 N-terminal domain-containing protein [uncultured Cohaesibacter sp.]
MKVSITLHRLVRILRAGVGMLIGMATYPIAWYFCFSPKDALARAVADLLMIGFYGTDINSPSARLLARQAARGQVGAVFFVAQNIRNKGNFPALVRLFSGGPARPMLAVDHEGGAVQRLRPGHGDFVRVPAARTTALQRSPEEARDIYARAGEDLIRAGFTINFGPVLDVDDPNNPAIGRWARAFSSDPEVIATYGEAFVEGFSSVGVLCVAKHFPGHGHAVDDSHFGAANISDTWTKLELEPFVRLIKSPHAPPMIMTGHLRLDQIEPSHLPATVSKPIVTGLLRERLGYQGVIVTDDIDMDAVRHFMDRKDAVIQALAAGSDIVMIKNLFGYDPFLPQRAVRWIRQAIRDGRLSEDAIMASAERVQAMRRWSEAKTVAAQKSAK